MVWVYLNDRILLYVIQGSLTGLHCSDEIAPSSSVLSKPWDQVPHFALHDNNAAPHRAQVIADYLLPTLQIWLLSIFGQRVAKNYPTPVDVYQLTRVLQQVWQSKLFRPLSSPWVSAG